MPIQTQSDLQILLKSVLSLQQSTSLYEGVIATVPEVASLINARAVWVYRIHPKKHSEASLVLSMHLNADSQWQVTNQPAALDWSEHWNRIQQGGSFLELPSESGSHKILCAPVEINGESLGFFIAETPVTTEGAFQQLCPYLEGLSIAMSRFAQENKIKVQRDYLRKIIDNIPGLVFSKDREGRFVLVNQRVAEIYGVPVKELIGKKDSDFNPYTEEVERYRAEDMRVLNEGASVWLPEDKIITPGGKEIHLQTLKIPVSSEDEEGTNNVLGLSLDVSLWRRIKEQEAQSRERYENFIKHAEEGIYYVKCDSPVPLEGITPEEQVERYYQSASIAECNKALAEMYGLDAPETLIGKRVADLHKGEGEPLNKATTLQFFKNNFKIKDFETHKITPEGKERWFNNHVVGVFENQHMVGIWGGQLDITARKQMELSLLEQREELNFVLEGAKVATWYWDLPGKIARFNDYFWQMLGYEASELPTPTPNKKFNELIHPDDFPGFIAKVTKHLELRNNTQVFEYEMRMRAKNGTYKWVLDRGRPLAWNEKGYPVQASGIFIDITSQKEAMIQLTAQQELLNMVSESALVAFWELNLETEAVKVSPTFFKILEYEAGAFELSTPNLYELIHTEDQNTGFKYAIQQIAQGESFDIELRLKTKSGSYKWAYARGEQYEFNGKKHYAGLLIDIHQRKQTELELKQSQDKLNMAIEGSRIGIWEWDIPNQKVSNNALMFKHLGHAPELLTDRYEDWVKYLHPDDVYRLQESFHLQTGASDRFRLDYRIRDVKGAYHWVYDTGKVTERNEHGLATQATGITVDISELKATEIALKESQQRTKLILDAAKLGLWEWNIQTDECFYNRHWGGMLGFKPEEIEPVSKTFFELIHPDDAPLLNKALNAQLEGKTELFDVEIRMRTKAGKWKWVHDKGQVMSRDKDGKPLRVAGIHIDIDHRKAAERALEESEAFFRTLYEDSPLGILFCNKEGAVEKVNEMASQILGYSKAELTGIELNTLSIEKKLFEGLMESFKRDSAINHFERQLRHKSGKVIWSNLLISIIRDAKGQPESIICSIEDITSRMEAQHALLESEDLQRAILDALPDLKFRIDKNLRFISFFAPRGDAPHLIVPPEVFLNKKVEEVLPLHIAQALKINLKKALVKGDVESFEYPMYLEGGMRFYEARVNSINDSEAIVVVRDITELKIAQQALQKKLRELDHNNEKLTRYVNSNLQLENFAHTVSHDLREPARTMNSFAQLLKHRYENQLDEDANSYLDFISKSATHMNKLIEDLLEFARFTNSEDPAFEEVDLNSLLEVVQQSLRGLIHDKNATIIIKRPLPILNGNPTKLGQLFQNLISNGVKFQAKGVKPEVTIEFQDLGDHWQFSVLDNGIGIDKEHHGHIFQLFRRLHSKKIYPGSGIGLALCKRVVEQHGGDIWVESKPEAGAKFIFTLHKNF
ncbi:MAG: PAS domain S-box protein [Phaeodactylibacter sp.]|uniref:PAS domain S-box protein n=1 Tax=Phaeodactylibacter sp. TaxID=1940289 RepID=UPI0032EC8CF2